MTSRLRATVSLLTLSLALAACATSQVSSAPPVTPEVAAILEANRVAEGGSTDPTPGTLTIKFKALGQGLTGTSSETSDATTGAFTTTTDLGALKLSNGFDGRRAWMTDMSGASTPQDGGDRIQVSVNEAYRYADLWWRADRGGAAITQAGRDNISGKTADHLVVAPPGGKPFDIWIDVASHLLVRLSEGQGSQTVTNDLSDYRPEGGRVLPHHQVEDDGTGEANRTTLDLVSATTGPSQPLTAYAIPASQLPNDHAIDGRFTVPFFLSNNHIYVYVEVNGRGPFPFIFDTGGHSIVTPWTVDQLSLGSRGQLAATGAGDKTTAAGFTFVKQLKLEKARLFNQSVLTLDFAPPTIEGFQMGGMLGFEFVRRFVVQLDYGAGTMTVMDPAAFDPKEAGTPVPFKFYDSNPYVEGMLDGRPARFNIDTGSRSEVTITAPYVQANNLLAAYPHGIEAVSGWGVGGPVTTFVTRVASVSLGEVKATESVIELADSKSGSFSDPNYDGNIGSGLLKRYVVTFDYAHQIMYLKPTQHPLADTGTFDRSGLWVNKGVDGLNVLYVTKGGPAEATGIKAGDVVMAIDGKPTDDIALTKARENFRVWPAGKIVPLEIRRGKKTLSLTITLRDQVPAHSG